MNDNKPGAGPKPGLERSKERAQEEAELDESIDESFPASDPSSVTRAPRDQRYAIKPPKEGADRQTPAHPGPEA